MSAPHGAAERRRRNRAGRRAEWIAAVWLALKGYRILARGFTVAGGEIDIVAWRGGTVAFVEVKARLRRDAALDAIDAAKRRRIARAAAVWLARHPGFVASSFRGDAVLVAPRRWPLHIPDAFPVVIGW